MDNLLSKCGFILKNGKEPNQLNQDQAVFQKKLSDQLHSLCDNPRVVELLTEDLANYVEDKNKFFFALQNSTVIDLGNSRQDNQDSLFRLLLGINLLQKSIVNLLFEKLAELSGMDESITWQGDHFNLTNLIVKQFRCVDKLENSEELCDKILEILEVVTVETQQNIIGCLPEIFPDNCHPTIARAFCAFLKTYSPVTVHVLDALSSLNISVELLTEIENSAALATAWMKAEHLPVVIRFLFNTCGERNTEVISTLRKNLGSTVFTKNTQQAKRMTSEERNQIVIILDQLKFFIQTKKAVAEAWVEVIRDDADPENEVIDLFITLILYSISSKESAADTLLQNQIKSGLFGEKALITIFETYHWAMKDYFDTAMKVATKFSKYDIEKFSKFGTNLYKNLYDHFDLGFKQAVIENLLDHFASYKTSEIDCAIELLTELTEKNPEQMASFAVYIKRIIDYFDRLALHQIRSIYSCLSILACDGGREGELLQNDLQTIVQKQLTNSDLKYKRIGIVGSLMLVKHLAPAKDTTENQHSKRALNLLELLHGAVLNETTALALFYDVVSTLILKRELNPKIEDWINDNVSNSFLDNYILDLNTCADASVQFSLDADDLEGGIVVNLHPLVESEEKNKGKTISTKASPLTLTPQFRLMQIYESTHNDGNLDEIDALLGCPILLFQMEKLDEFPNLDVREKNLICLTLFHTLNWFREVINAFTSQSDLEIRGKVVSRLKDITNLETILRKCLTSNPGFRPPLAHFDVDEKITKVSLKRKKEGSDKHPEKKQKKNDTAVDETQMSSTSSSADLADTTKKSTAKKTKEKEPTIIALSQFAMYFRELDFDVFDLLKEKMNLPNSTIVSQMDKNLLSPLELIFLLEDLKAKLEFRLRPSPEKPSPFGHKGSTVTSSRFANLSSKKLSDIVKETIALIPYLCLHLESASQYFQTINIDVMDSAESRSEPSIMIASCLKLILESLSILFSWKEFDQHQTLQQTAINHLANRLSSSGGSQLNIEDSVNRALDYVIKFSESVPNFSCAMAVLSLGEKLFAFNKTDANINRLSAMAEEFLKRPWFDKDGESEHGAKHNQDLLKVLTLSFELNSDRLKLLQTLTTVALPELTETQVESKTYRTMTKLSFSLYYRVIFANLVKEAKQIAKNKSEDVAVLLRWNLAVRTFHILVNTVKVFGNQTNFISCVKNSRYFVDTFLKLGMPLMDSALRNHKDEVMEVLRVLQLGTRFLQNVCCHAKMINQVAIVKHIPHLKKNLEAFIYRVKAMLALHSCQDAFWVGNLKNKDIQGDEIHVDADEDEDFVENEGGGDEDDVPEELQDDAEEGEQADEIVDDEEDSYSQSY